MQYKVVNRKTESSHVVRRMGRIQMFLKRSVDIVCALLGLILLSPVFLVIYITLLLQCDGKVIFKQERIGYKGRPFQIYKFRTMHMDAESNGQQLAEKNDDRLTRAGRFLRMHHLDELPQFWNVLKGDMSMVGPRPERQYFIDKIMKEDSRYRCLYQVRPGVTSEATLYNGYTYTLDKMLERLSMDLRYVETATLLSDFSIMFKTIRIIVMGDGKSA